MSCRRASMLVSPPGRRPGSAPTSAKSGRLARCRDHAEDTGCQSPTPNSGSNGHRLYLASFFPFPGGVVPGTVIQVKAEKMPDGTIPDRELWLWWTAPPGTPCDLDVIWRGYADPFTTRADLLDGAGPVPLSARKAHCGKPRNS